MSKLTQSQVKNFLSDIMTEPNGIKRLMELIVEITMKGERELYKEVTGDVSNVNRYRGMVLKSL